MTALSPYDSLVLAHEVELWGAPGGTASVNPMCPGAVFAVMPGFDLSAPQATQDFVAQLATDGERPYGTRSSDRVVTLPVRITAPEGDWTVLAGARELLLSLIDQPYYTLTWTRRASPEDTQGLPVVFDCFRAKPSQIQYGGFDLHELHPVQLITLSFEALPYGHSDIAQQIAFAAPVAALNAPPPPPATVVLDTFAQINNPQCTQSAVHAVGPYSCYWDPASGPAASPDGSGTAFAYSAPLSSAVNLSGHAGITFWLGLGTRYRFNTDRDGTHLITAAMTLTDGGGHTLPFTSRARIPCSTDPASPVFTQFTMAIPKASSVFDFTSVSAYRLVLRNRAPRDSAQDGELRWTCAYLDELKAVPPSATPVAPSVRGSIYTLSGVLGTAHATAALSFQQAPAPGTPTTVTTAGSGTYTVPAGTAYLKAECWGGGGAGATQTIAGVGGGGGGGEYAAEPSVPAAAGQVIPYSIGAGSNSPAAAGSTVFGGGASSGATVVANGGFPAQQNTTAGGAGGTGSVNTIRYPGGAGRTASGSVGGGGGSSASAAGPGNTPMGTAAVTLSGIGNWTCPAGVTQVTAYAIGGGGGGGSGSSSADGAGGGGGESAQRTFPVVPGTLYPYAVGGGGAGGSSSGGITGSGGGGTTFTVAGITLTAHGGSGGPASAWWGDGGLGGTGSAATLHNDGGDGGGPQPYTGGGGSSGGSNGEGNDGDNYANPGAAPAGGGAGGAGSGAQNGAGHAGAVPGGGGGGSYNAGYAGGNGAAGTLTLTYPGGGSPTSAGGIAPAGGGAGGAGGSSANTPGSAGSAPGGGGGGADSAGTTEAGGAGGTGKLTVTPFLPPQFKTLIAHRPGAACPIELNPLVAIGGIAPGATEFPVVSLIAGRPARFDGTYSVVLVSRAWNSPGSSRNITVTVRQYEYPGGAFYDTPTATLAITPSTMVSNGVLVAGICTLPSHAVPKDNNQAYYTAFVTDSNGSDTWWDILLLDSQGQTTIINETGSGYFTYYIDTPDPCHAQGQVLGSQAGRGAAISVSDTAVLSGGPLTLVPGRNTLLCYSPDGAPAVSVSYFPAYHIDRLW